MLTLDLRKRSTLGRKLGSSKELQSSKVFLKLKTWKKTWIFKGALIFEGGRLQELRRLLSFGRILSRPSGVKNFQPPQMKRTSPFIEFPEVTPPSEIQLLLGDDRAFAVRSTALVGTIGHLRRLERWYCRQRSNFYRGTIGLLSSDPPPVRSDQTLSSFQGVILPSVIQLLSGDDRAFAVRSTSLIHRPGRSDQAPSSFGEVILLSAIQLLSRDDQAFTVRSTPWSDRAPSLFGEVILPSAIQLLSGDDRAFTVRSTVLVERSGTIVVWRGDIAISDPTSIGGRSGFCRQIHPLVGAIGHLRPLEG
ncbi:hypothetical protein E6C27_scaffold149G001590 [Cucumis melo var. makuwa]|uniref:Uncharacterized protein n=1 Tax=Cucumis melo var. makuwa TaxID=1194695 RepID=A0A5A7TTM6_CUCMM|nr:hypothetical protein E6C27_scaffold149G001590 [Cucumis melo var. makuwa]